MPDPGPGDVLNVVLTEFKALRDEINQRATYCHTLININVVASATLAGLVLGNPRQIELLLILPVLSPVLGLLWIDHSYAIRNMGDYINTELKPAVARTVPRDPELLRWETYLDEHERKHKTLRFLPLGVPILVVFSAVPAFALVRAYTEIGFDWKAALDALCVFHWEGVVRMFGWKGTLWALGFVLTLAFFLLWLVLLLTPYFQQQRTPTTPLAGTNPEVPGHA